MKRWLIILIILMIFVNSYIVSAFMVGGDYPDYDLYHGKWTDPISFLPPEFQETEASFNN